VDVVAGLSDMQKQHGRFRGVARERLREMEGFVSPVLAGETVEAELTFFCLRTVWLPPLVFSSGRRYWLWIVFGRISSGLISGIYHP
jgi:hypothetical protein